MGFEKLFVYIGYTLSGTFIIVGVAVLSGLLLPPYVPQKIRIMFGTVMLLYGAYRFVTSRIKQQRQNEEESLQ